MKHHISNWVISCLLGLVVMAACVIGQDGEAKFSPVAAHGQVKMAVGDLETAVKAYPEAEALAELLKVLEAVEDGLEIYINGGGEGDALMTAMSLAQFAADKYITHEEYAPYAIVLDIALRRVRSSLPKDLEAAEPRPSK